VTATPWAGARRTAYEAVAPLPAVELPLADALGLALAGDLWALTALPAFDTAAMDGWAVRGPGPWRVAGGVLAGDAPPPPLADGAAVEIATGAMVPDGCDGVLPYEDAALLDDEVTGPAPLGRHVRRTGEECPPRTVVLPGGSLLSPAALGLAAAVGHDVLRAVPRPRVAALVTGSELLTAGLPGAGRVRDAVGPLLPGAVAHLGGVLVSASVLPDDRAALVEAVTAADADLVVTSGASSVGRADHLSAALGELGAEVLVDGVAVKPGHPQLLARLPDGRLLVGLPGNPLAALSALVTLVGPVLARLGGRALPAPGGALAGAPLAAVPGVTRLVPVRLSAGRAMPTGHGGAAMLRGAAVADAFAVVDTELSAGDPVPVLLLP
jgi:molybdopterin molybdotransferase